MTFEFDAATIAARDAADHVALDLVAPAAAGIDAAASVPADLVAQARAALPAPSAGAGWVLAVEALAAVSASVALGAAATALGRQASATAQWTGLRGFDADGAGAALADDAAWQQAVTATLIGSGRAALDASVVALKAARAAKAPHDAAQPALADAATAIDSARLLLLEAAGMRGEAGETARALARLQTLDAVTLAFTAAEQAAGVEAFRPGTPLERARRDAVTTAQVLGAAAAMRATAAAGVLPA